MAKKEKTDAATSVYDDIVGLMMQSASEAGMALAPYSEHAKTIKVVPVPSIALQWLINSNGWPVGRTTTSAGDPKTFKSTFAQQLMAWFLMAGGMATMIDTENKQSGETLEAMVDATGINPDDLKKRCLIGSAQSMEQWQAIVLKHSDMLKSKYGMPEKCPLPFINVVDSLTGVNSQAGTDELVENEGGVAQSRVGQQNAKALFQFMRDGARRSMSGDQPSTIRWPVCLHTVSHQRDRGDGFKGKERSGGVSPDFYTSLDLVFSMGGTSAYNNSFKKTPDCGKQGRVITITVRYSSMGPDGKDQNISVPVIMEYERLESGMNRRTVVYDWGAADTHFLAQNYNKIKGALDMEVKYVRGHGLYAKSSTLGILDFIPATAFGYEVQTRPEIMTALQNELGITIREPIIYLPGVGGAIRKPRVDVIDVDNPPPALPDGDDREAEDEETSSDD